MKSIFVLFVILSILYALLRYTNIFKFNIKNKYTSSYYDYNSFGGTTSSNSSSTNSNSYYSSNSSYSLGNNNNSNVNKYFSNGPGLINRKYANYNHIPVSSSTSFAAANNSNNPMQQRSNQPPPQNLSPYSIPSAQPITISNYDTGRNANTANNNSNAMNNKYYQPQPFGIDPVNYYNSNDNKPQPTPSYQTPLPNPHGTPLQSLNNNLNYNHQNNNATVMNVQNNYAQPSTYSMNYSLSSVYDNNNNQTLNPNPKHMNTMGSQDIKKKNESNLYNSSINISDAYFPHLQK